MGEFLRGKVRQGLKGVDKWISRRMAEEKIGRQDRWREKLEMT